MGINSNGKWTSKRVLAELTLPGSSAWLSFLRMHAGWGYISVWQGKRAQMGDPTASPISVLLSSAGDPTTTKASCKRSRKWAGMKPKPTQQTKQSPTGAEREQDQGRQVELPGKVLLLIGQQQAESRHALLQTALCVKQKYRGAFQGWGHSTQDADFVVMPPLSESWEEEQFMGCK